MGTCASRPSVLPTEPSVQVKAIDTSVVKDLQGLPRPSPGNRKHDWTPRDKIPHTDSASLSSSDDVEEAQQAKECPSINAKQCAADTDDTSGQPVVRLVDDMLGQPYDVYARGPPTPPCNDNRVQAVKNLCMMDQMPVPEIDHIMTLLCQVFQVDAALVALFGDKRIFISNAKGFQSGDFPWRWSFCAWSLSPPQPEVLLIENVAEDARFRDNEVAGSLGIEFYCGSPILGSSNHRLGTLCFVDSKPRKFGAEQLTILANLAEMVGRELEKGAMAYAQTQMQQNFMSRALECFTAAIAFVDVRTPAWRIMHSSPAFSQATHLTAEEMAGALLWELLETPAAGFDVVAAAADIAAAGNEFVLSGVTVRGHKESGTFDLRLRPAGRDVLDEHTRPVGIPSHVVSQPQDAEHYLFVTLTRAADTSHRKRAPAALPPLTSTAEMAGKATSAQSLSSGQPSSNRMSRRSSLESVEAAFFVDRGSAPSSLPFEGLQLGPLVGCGSYGRVYRGTFQNSTIAVKVCQPKGSRRSAAAKAAWTTVEARAKRLAHPNIVRLLRHCTVLAPAQNNSSSYKMDATSDKHVVVAKTEGAAKQMPQVISPASSIATTSSKADRLSLPPNLPRPFDSARSLRLSIASPSPAHSSSSSSIPARSNDTGALSKGIPEVSATSDAYPGSIGKTSSVPSLQLPGSFAHMASPSRRSLDDRLSDRRQAGSTSSSCSRASTPGRITSPFSLAPPLLRHDAAMPALSRLSNPSTPGRGDQRAAADGSAVLGSTSASSSEITSWRGSVTTSPHVTTTNSSSGGMAAGSSCSRAASIDGVETWQLMEYCDRGSLQGAIDKGWFRQERTTRIMGGNLAVILPVAREICSAMAYLHGERVVHGDLASGNVLLTSDSNQPHGFTAKVADFGLARELALECQLEADTSYGTVTHMPPEVLSGKPFERSADVWSFGVLLWEMWCGVRAWAGLNRPQVIYAVAINHQPLLFPPETPSGFKALAMSCMAINPADRPSFDELEGAIQHFSYDLVTYEPHT